MFNIHKITLIQGNLVNKNQIKKMKNACFFVLIFSLFLCSCGGESSPPKYERGINDIISEHLDPTKLNDTFLFFWPKDIFIVDSILIIHDSNNRDTGLHIFNKNSGEYYCSFCKRGIGPGEFVEINSASYCPDTESLVIYDPNQKKISSHNIRNILNSITPTFEEYSIHQSPNYIKQAIPLTQSSFIMKGNTDKMRYGFWNSENKEFSRLYTKYPALTKDDETNWSITDYFVKTGLNKEQTKLVTGTYIGGILEVFDVSDSGLNLSCIRFFDEPIYDYASGAVPRWVITKPETIIGFQDINLCNNKIYGLYWGVKIEEMERNKPRIVVFDLEGKPERQFTFNDIIDSFAIDSDGSIYAVALDANGEYSLNKYEIRTP